MIGSLTQRGSIRKTQRGFLVNIIGPLMKQFYFQLGNQIYKGIKSRT